MSSSQARRGTDGVRRALRRRAKRSGSSLVMRASEGGARQASPVGSEVQSFPNTTAYTEDRPGRMSGNCCNRRAGASPQRFALVQSYRCALSMRFAAVKSCASAWATLTGETKHLQYNDRSEAGFNTMQVGADLLRRQGPRPGSCLGDESCGQGKRRVDLRRATHNRVVKNPLYQLSDRRRCRLVPIVAFAEQYRLHV